MPHQGQEIGQYRLLRKIGKGAFGQVWLAEKRTQVVNRQVAVKIPVTTNPDFNSIKQEANLWIQASGHPNVLPFLDADICDGYILIVSEYAADGSLETWLTQDAHRPPSIEEAVSMMIGILSGLEHLHTRKIIHRDLKPANILLRGNTPLIADFGLSRVLQSTNQSIHAAGTPVYMAPEAFDRKRDIQTDIWSAGVIFYEILSRKLPFRHNDYYKLAEMIRTQDPEPLPAYIPQPIQQVIAKALKKMPSERFNSVGQMLAALKGDEEEIIKAALAKHFTENDLSYLKLKFKMLFLLFRPHGISIESVSRKQFFERYIFNRKGERACVDFYYNKNGQFTKTQFQDGLSNSPQILEEIKGILHQGR